MPEAFENLNVYEKVAYNATVTYDPTLNMMDLNDIAMCLDSNMAISPMDINSYNSTSTNFITGIELKPELKILVQPVDKFRFRYKSEMMGTHGSLLGDRDDGTNRKGAPTVKLENYPGNAIIRCTLVTAEEENRMPHAHRLVRRDGNTDCDDPHDLDVSEENNFTAVFHGMGIIHTAKKHLKEELIRKKRRAALNRLRCADANVRPLSVREETEIQMEAEAAQKDMNLNSVALSFQAFVIGEDNILTPITEPVYSTAINNLKSALTGELKICRIDKYACSSEGSEEVFMLVEKVGKKNIKIKFYEVDERGNEIWANYGQFSELDVHHQYAIVFRTPPYRNTDITEPKEVYVKLERPSDGECSNSLRFIYKPSEKFTTKKRLRTSYSNSTELMSLIQNTNTMINTNVINNETMNTNDRTSLSRELSECLKRNDIPEELRTILDDPSMHELFNDYTELVSNNLTIDGSSTHSDEIFAQDTLKLFMEIMKDNTPDSKIKLKSLLEETSTYGETRLHSALRYGLKDVVDRILMVIGSDIIYHNIVNLRTICGKTPLHYAVAQNEPEVVKALILLNADQNCYDDEGNSPLYYAVKLPEAGVCVDILLNAKLKTNQFDEFELSSLLHLATKSGSLHAVKSLIKAGANVNCTDRTHDRTVLHVAVEGGHKDIVSYLLEETNVDVNKKNMSGNTALHHAVVGVGSRAKEICKLLVQHGADPLISNRSSVGKHATNVFNCNVEVKSEIESDGEEEQAGQTPLDLAESKPDVKSLLVSNNEHESSISETNITIKHEIEEIENKDEDHIIQLAAILDETKGWMKLADKMGYSFLVNLLKENTASSPAYTFIKYALDNTDGITPEKMLEILEEIGETKAASELSKIINN